MSSQPLVQVVPKSCFAKVTPPEWSLSKKVLVNGELQQNATISVVPCTSLDVTYQIEVSRENKFGLAWLSHFLVKSTGVCNDPISLTATATVVIMSGVNIVVQQSTPVTIGQVVKLSDCTYLPEGMCGPFEMVISVTSSCGGVEGPVVTVPCCDLSASGSCDEPCRCLWDTSECVDTTQLHSPVLSVVAGLNPSGPNFGDISSHVGTGEPPFPLTICAGDFICGGDVCQPITFTFTDTITAPSCGEGCGECACSTINTATLVIHEDGSEPKCPLPTEEGCQVQSVQSTLNVKCVPLAVVCDAKTKCKNSYCVCKSSVLVPAETSDLSCCTRKSDYWFKCSVDCSKSVAWPIDLFEFPQCGTQAAPIAKCDLFKLICSCTSNSTKDTNKKCCSPDAASCFFSLLKQYISAILNINVCEPGAGSGSSGGESTLEGSPFTKLPENIQQALIKAQIVLGNAIVEANCELCDIAFPYQKCNTIPKIGDKTITEILTLFNNGQAGYPSCGSSGPCATIITGPRIDYNVSLSNQTSGCEVCVSFTIGTQDAGDQVPAYVTTPDFFNYQVLAHPSEQVVAQGTATFGQEVKTCIPMGDAIGNIPSDTTSVDIVVTYGGIVLDVNTGTITIDDTLDGCTNVCTAAVNHDSTDIPLTLQDCITITCNSLEDTNNGGCDCGSKCKATIIPTGDACVQDLVNLLFANKTVSIPTSKDGTCGTVSGLTAAQKLCLFGDGTEQNPPHDLTFSLQFANTCCGCCLVVRNDAVLVVGDGTNVGCAPGQPSSVEIHQSSILNAVSFPDCCGVPVVAMQVQPRDKKPPIFGHRAKAMSLRAKKH